MRCISPRNFSRVAVPLLTLVGSLIASSAGVAAPATGPLRRLESNPRYFTDGSGRAIFLTGSHTWANFATDQGRDEPVAFNYEGYLDFLTAHGHNFIRGWIWDVPYSIQGSNGGPFRWGPQPWLRTGPGLATDGKPKFDLNRFNPEYFDRLRSRVIAARDRGVYVSIMLFQGYAWKLNRMEGDGFPLDGRNNINAVDAGPAHAASTLEFRDVTAVQEAYVRKVIETVNDLDNVLFEIANEAHEHSTAWQYHFIDFIHAYERTLPRQHPVGMTSHFIGKRPHEELMTSPADWVSPTCRSGYIDTPPIANGDKVVILDTDHGYMWRQLRDHGPARQQAWVWKCFLTGHQVLFMDPYLAHIEGRNAGRNHPGGLNPDEPYFGLTPDPVWNTIRIAMGRTRFWADKIDLAATLPHPELASTGYCVAQPGQEYLVYNPGPALAFSVTLPAGEFEREWYNPTTGQTVGVERWQVDATGSQLVTAPFEGDSVLHLKRGASNSGPARATP